MALTVRLSPKTERLLNSLAARRKLSRSDVVREAIARFDASEPAGDSVGRPFQAWLDVIGIVRLGVRDPARTTGQQFRTVLERRAKARRAR
jgi:hypothetical protein